MTICPLRSRRRDSRALRTVELAAAGGLDRVRGASVTTTRDAARALHNGDAAGVRNSTVAALRGINTSGGGGDALRGGANSRPLGGLSAVLASGHATLIASVLVGANIHAHNRVIPMNAAIRQRPPPHHGLVRRMFASSAMAFAELLDRASSDDSDPRAITAEWDRCAAVIVHMSEEPNWRTKPSMLDQLVTGDRRARPSASSLRGCMVNRSSMGTIH